MVTGLGSRGRSQRTHLVESESTWGSTQIPNTTQTKLRPAWRRVRRLRSEGVDKPARWQTSIRPRTPSLMWLIRPRVPTTSWLRSEISKIVLMAAAGVTRSATKRVAEMATTNCLNSSAIRMTKWSYCVGSHSKKKQALPLRWLVLPSIRVVEK